MTLHSALYEGRVRHRRMTPRAHAFEFPLFMVYLDLAELDKVFSLTRLWSARHPAPARFCRSDYLGDADTPLDAAVRDRVALHTGARPEGPIRLLTHLRYFGYCFNPVSFYYCFDPSGRRVETIVAEITNTPWKERHAYVLPVTDASSSGRLMRWRFAKDFHVSPFMPMDLAYDWSFTAPEEHIFVHMNLRPPGTNAPRCAKAFDATLTLNRRELSPSSMRRSLLRYPLMTARVIARIHFEALRLWLKRIPAYSHPAAAPRSAKPHATEHRT